MKGHADVAGQTRLPGPVEHPHACVGRRGRGCLPGRRPHAVDTIDVTLGIGLRELEDGRRLAPEAHREGRRRQGQHVDRVGVEGPEAPDQPEEVAARHLLVDGDVVDADPDELVQLERVAGRQGLLEHAADEVLLALDAAQVAGGVGVPAPALVGLVVATAGPGQGLEAGELDTAGRLDDEAADGVPGRRGHVDTDSAHGVDDALEAHEVDGDVVVDPDAEVVLDGVDQALRPGLGAVEGGVDAIGAAGPGDRDVQVTRDGEDGRLPTLVVGVEDHDRVAALTRHEVLAGLLRLLSGDVGSAVRADEQHVENVSVGEQVGDLLLLDLGEPPPQLDVAAGRRQDGEDQEGDRAVQQVARPSAGPHDHRPRLGLPGRQLGSGARGRRCLATRHAGLTTPRVAQDRG